MNESPEPIRAAIEGAECAHACGIMVTGSSPVLRLCRELVKAGHDEATPLVAYRGDVPCLLLASIGEGAKLTVQESGAAPVFAPWKPFCRPAVPSPMRPNERAATQAAQEAA